jgi:cation diffusion facilitator CzcD-associated flavoprotein CzcO
MSAFGAGNSAEAFVVAEEHRDAGRPPPSGEPGTVPAPLTAGGDALPDHVLAAVVGAGFGGIGVGIRLREAGLADFVILERAGAVGGTWRDNTYPGCACDVPSHVYSYSFAPNPGWSRSFSGQQEIWQYLRGVADRYRVSGHIRLGTEVTAARWDPAAALWRLQTSRGALSASVLIVAAGALSEPSLPAVPGLDSFPGEVMHSARWDHTVNTEGKRVAVVGTGASAIQVVPAIAPQVASLALFQRTPPWVMPRHDRPISPGRQRLYSRIPAAQKLSRLSLFLQKEVTVGAFVRWPWMLRAVQRVALAHLSRSVTDPDLRAKLTPDYVMGCKRVLVSDDFYPALTRQNVRLVASGLAKADGPVLTAQDGSTFEADVIIFATGFRIANTPMSQRILRADGSSLADAWGDAATALRGTTVAGFPNMCLVTGPNSGLGHNSMIHIIESQLSYICEYVQAVTRLGGKAALDVTPGAQQRWNAMLAGRLARSVWLTGGCTSWYLTAPGRNPAMWPGSTLAFRHATAHLDLREYQARPAGTPA